MPSLLDDTAAALQDLEPIRRRVLRDAELRTTLSEIEDWHQFASVVIKVGEEIGARPTIEGLDALRRMNVLVDRSGLLASQIEETTDVELLDGWIPLRVSWRNGLPIVSWFLRYDIRFVDPFFVHTAQAWIQKPFNIVFRQETSIDLVGKYVQLWPGRQPNGIIYHMSRCGSTLAAQMFAALPSMTVLSEPDPVDSLLDYGRHNPNIEAQEAADWIRWIVAAIAGPGPASNQGLIIKADSWHILQFVVMRAAFPHSPWIFLFREPVEVLVSLRRMCGRRAMPGALDPAMLGISFLEACSMPDDSYRTWLLQCVCNAALNNLDDGGMSVNYADLPDAVSSWLPEYFGLILNGDERTRMDKAKCRHAKQPSHAFEPDGADKKAEATVEILNLAQVQLVPLYEQLNRSCGR
jgi:hypothetical protein